METETETNSFQIKTPAFEGPLGLLLNLVEERKLFINDLSLSLVTEDYLKYINQLGNINPSAVSSFIVVAATLILIKSKSLLPSLDLTDEEKEDIRDLEERLRLYEIFKRHSEKVKNIFGKRIIFAPLPRKEEIVVFLPDKQITRESMMTFASGVIARIPKKIILPEVEVRKVVTLEEMIGRLTDRIKNSLKMKFHEFAGKSGTREERVVVIVGFLAMLELVRQGILNAVQEGDGKEIIIERQEVEINS